MSKTSPRMALQQQGSCEGGEANGSHDSNSRYCERRLPVERASLTALQESVKALVMNVTCGRKSGVFCRRLGPDGSWEKTSQGCFPQIMETSSVEPSLTWPRWGTLLDGVLMEQSMWERGIEETGCSLLPTPSTQEIEHPEMDLTESGRRLSKDPGNSHSIGQSDTVKMLPTPQSRDWKGQSQRGAHKPGDCRPNAVMWPTPKVPSGGGQMERTTPGGGIRKLEDKVSQLEGYNTGILNPEWVTWLMGFPPGWLNPMESPELPQESKPE